MAAKVLNVSDARRLLPGLVRDAVKNGAVSIGVRGRASAVLVSVEEYQLIKARAGRAPVGESPWARLRLRPTGTIREVEAELLAMRRERATALGSPPTPGKQQVKRKRSGR